MRRADRAGWESTTYVTSFKSIDEFGPLLRQEALRRGFGSADKAVVLIDGAIGLANMAKFTFPAAFKSSTSTMPWSTRASCSMPSSARRIPITSLGFTTGQNLLKDKVEFFDRKNPPGMRGQAAGTRRGGSPPLLCDQRR